jgi:uncharacterized cupredoxin-like copper-binding protein
MRFKSSWFQDGLWIILLALGLSLVPIHAAAHYVIEKAKEQIEQSLRATFEAFNKRDINGFVDGWTDAGFMNKTMFRLLVTRPFAKDEVPRFFQPMQGRGIKAGMDLIKLVKISNIMIRDEMMTQATAELEIIQGYVRERYGLGMVKRMGLDKRWKIDRDVLLPVVPNGFSVVEIKMTEYAFEFDKSQLARDMVLKLVNVGTRPHEFVLFKKMPDANLETSVARGMWSLEPGKATNLVVTGLEPGPYVMVCCTLDPDHKPHCDKGMRTEITIQ